MNTTANANMIEILLVEDDPADVRLTMEALKHAKMHTNLSIARDGIDALAFLRRQGKFSAAARPDIIFLDLNMPRMDGREFLAKIKEDPELKHIPIVVLTTSASDEDILRTYKLHANCFVTKPVDLQQFIKVVSSIECFWFTVVKLPVSSEESK
jgi:two-component system, chemotaxis family, response regulator Rcp1